MIIIFCYDVVWWSEFQGGIFGLEVIVGKVPVDDIGEIVDIGGSDVAVIDVVGVLPYIHGQNWFEVAGQRVSGVRCIEDNQLTVGVSGQPGPSRAEISNCLGRELSEEVGDTAPFCHNLRFELRWRFGLIGCDGIPIEGVIPMLGSIIEDLLIFAAE